MIDSTEFSYPQEDFDHEPSTTTTALQVYHAPFSIMHIETQQQPNSIEVNFNNNGKYYIPQTEEINKERSLQQFKQNLNLLSTEKRGKIAGIYNNFPKNGQLYGEYLPQTYKKTKNHFNGTEETDGKSVDPIKYITNLLIERSIEHPNKAQEIVLHPDIIYFASKGRIENLPKVLDYLNRIVDVLEQKLFFENISFTNEKYKESLGVFENPFEIYKMIKDYPRLGIVIDIQHLEKSNKSNTLNNIKDVDSERVIIHARKGYKDIYNDLYMYSIRNGIPWIVEE